MYVLLCCFALCLYMGKVFVHLCVNMIVFVDDYVCEGVFSGARFLGERSSES